MTFHSHYEAIIEGKTWEGFDSELTLEFPQRPTLEDIKARAGDFESYSIVSLVRQDTQLVCTPVSLAE